MVHVVAAQGGDTVRGILKMNNFNAITNTFYSVANQKHLEDHKELFHLESDEWAGFKQWAEKGRKIKKGAKGCKVYMVVLKNIEETAKEKRADDKEKRTVLKGVYVFNLEHTEEIEKQLKKYFTGVKITPIISAEVTAKGCNHLEESKHENTFKQIQIYS